MDAPCFFEAVLGAEMGRIEIHFFAGGADHGGGFAAAGGPAFVF